MQTILCNFFSQYSLFLLLFMSSAHAQGVIAPKELVSIKDAWVRPTNPGQDVGAAYMTLTSSKDVTLIAIESDTTPSVEIHSMTMQNGVMKMRMLETLPLASGKMYKLSPGGFHLMLFDLKKPLIVGNQVNFVLTFKKKNSALFKQNVKAIVQTSSDSNNKTH